MRQPVIRPIPKINKYELKKSYRVKIRLEGSKKKIEIDAPFVWDGASIPRIAWTTGMPPWHPKLIVPSLIHDYMYRWHHLCILLKEGGIFRQAVNRKQADKIFYEIMKKQGVSWYNRHKFYRAVRIFGGSAW